jgi:class 3 adenylate cyclase
LFGLVQYLNTLPVSDNELLFLRSRQPFLVARALAHILRGSLGRGVMALLLAALLIGLFWIVAASVGRMATVRPMLEYFRRKVNHDLVAAGIPNDRNGDVASNVSTGVFFSLLRLNFLRAIVALSAIVGFAGAWILAGFASPRSKPQPGLAFSLFLPLAGVVCYVAWALNWLLSLAQMFAVRDGEDAVGAISAAVSFCRERWGAVVAVGTWTGLAHLAVFLGATTVVSVPLGLGGLLPWRLVALGVVLVTLAYLAVADWLYMARLAGYVCIAETPEALLRPLPPTAAARPSGPPVQTSIDRDELILSDLPNLAVET